MCFLGIGCSSSTSTTNETNYNDNSTTDNRVAVNTEGAGDATLIGNSTVDVKIDSHNDSHNISTVDSHNVTTDHNAVQAGADVATRSITANENTTNAALNTNKTVTQSALDAAKAAAEAAAEAQRRTASDAIGAIRATASDATELARHLGTDAIQFGATVSQGFIAASSDLNRLVGTLSDKNGEFLEHSVDQILARSQSADQQNLEAMLDTLKWVAGFIAAGFAVSYIFKGARA